MSHNPNVCRYTFQIAAERWPRKINWDSPLGVNSSIIQIVTIGHNVDVWQPLCHFNIQRNSTQLFICDKYESNYGDPFAHIPHKWIMPMRYIWAISTSCHKPAAWWVRRSEEQKMRNWHAENGVNVYKKYHEIK